MFSMHVLDGYLWLRSTLVCLVFWVKGSISWIALHCICHNDIIFNVDGFGNMTMLHMPIPSSKRQ